MSSATISIANSVAAFLSLWPARGEACRYFGKFRWLPWGLLIGGIMGVIRLTVRGVSAPAMDVALFCSGVVSG